jgi:glucose-1-phosphate thymidylyltransferase
MKGVIICGGLGTRLYPLTKTINKQLLPIYDQPLVYYPLRTLMRAGIKEFMIISAIGHAGQFLEHFGDNTEFENIRFEYAIQKNPTAGIAQALSLAADFVGTSKAAVILGDNIYEDDLSEEIKKFAAQEEKGAKIFLKEVPDPRRFGCPEFGPGGGICRIDEKPAEPKSNFCVTGLYLYDNRVWDVIKNIKPSERGQLEITDVNNFYVYEGTMQYAQFNGEWIDAGTFPSLLRANIWAAKKQGIDVSELGIS